jgi:hypothetical protein
MDDSLAFKKDLILNSLSSGIPLERGFILAQCTPQEIDELQEDVEFQSMAQYTEVEREMELLGLHTSAMEEAARKGNATAIQWKLERLYPDRWGAKQISLPLELVDPHSITDETAQGMSEDQLKAALSKLEKDEKCTP